jgi:hypothetical protein
MYSLASSFFPIIFIFYVNFPPRILHVLLENFLNITNLSSREDVPNLGAKVVA